MPKTEQCPVGLHSLLTTAGTHAVAVLTTSAHAAERQ